MVDCEKDFWQYLHEYGLSPVCILACDDNLLLDMNLKYTFVLIQSLFSTYTLDYKETNTFLNNVNTG